MVQYLFKKSDRSIWNIYYDEAYGNIFIRRYNSRRQTWQEPVISIKNTGSQLACDIDGDDNIHIVFTGSKGDIYYGRFDGSRLTHFPVLSGKNPTYYDKNLSILCCGSSFYIFYTLRHQERVLLTMQEVFPEKSSADSPQALDYVSDSDGSYKVFYSSGNIYLVYLRAGQEAVEKNSLCPLTARCYSLSGKNPLSFFEFPSDCMASAIHSCYVDPEGTLTVLAAARGRLKEIRVHDYLKYSSGPAVQSGPYPGRAEVQDIDFNHDPREYFASGFFLGSAKYIYFCGISHLYIYKSTDLKNYEAAAKIPLGNGRLFHPLLYKSNYPGELPLLAGPSLSSTAKSFLPLPGKSSGTPLCHIFNPFSARDPESPELETAFLESLKLVQKEINRLESLISRLDGRISRLEGAISQMERDLQKLDIRLKKDSI